MRRVASVFLAMFLALALLPGVATANEDGNNGQAIGQDEYRLALTRCSNAGIGNGAEEEIGLYGFISVKSECLEKHFPHLLYTYEEMEAIEAQSTCEWIKVGWLYFKVCEVDPGNSEAHNANNYE